MNKFRYKKHLGQNFLHNIAILNKISDLICKNKNDLIFEIGAGIGTLTEYLVKKAEKVVAIEVDNAAINIMKEKFKDIKNLEIINCDFLKFDLKGFLEKINRKVTIAGNIPYYITSLIIEKIIENRYLVNAAFLTVQKEVAERIVAKDGNKTYGSLSIFCQFYADVKILFKIKKKSFFPVPDVDSCFVEFNFEKKQKIKVFDEKLFFKIVHSGFAHRRKMFINNFKKTFNLSYENTIKLLKKAQINEKARAEDISILKFAELSNMLYNL